MFNPVRRVPRDAWVALLIFAASAAGGVAYVATFSGTAYFAQHMFGPAAMWACGRGFDNPMMSRAPGLEDFLYSRSACLDCAQVPADIPVVDWETGLPDDQWPLYHPHPEYGGWLNCQRFHLYLLGSVALLWRLLGVAWSSLLPMYGVLFGITGAASYGLFRLVMRRIPAALFALLFVAAPLHVQQLPDLRDYAKAPFFLSAIFLMGVLVSKRLGPRMFAAVCAASGTILGVGIGFRQDLLMCIPPFFIAALLLAPGNPLREKKKRLAGVATFLLIFLVLGGPILRVLFLKGNNSSHDTLIGFTRYCSDRLGVGSPVYDFGDPFLDEYTRAVVESYNNRLHNGHDRLRHYTPAYDRAGAAYFREMVANFPADLVTRAYASVLRIVDEMRPDPRAPWPRDVDSPALQALYKAHGALTRFLLTHGRYAATLALLLIGAYDVRLGLSALFLLAWFAGYPSLRFSVRHSFHMQIVSYLVAGFLVQRALDLATMARSREGRAELRCTARQMGRSCGRNALVFTVIAVTAATVPLWVLRVSQHISARTLLYSMAQTSLELLDVQRLERPEGRVLVQANGFAALDPAGPSTQTELLVVELAPGSGSVPLVFRYEAEDPERDFTRIVQAPLENAPVRIYFPVYYSAQSHFAGVELSAADADKVLNLYRSQGFEHVPVLLTATVGKSLHEMPLHYEMTR